MLLEKWYYIFHLVILFDDIRNTCVNFGIQTITKIKPLLSRQQTFHSGQQYAVFAI